MWAFLTLKSLQRVLWGAHQMMRYLIYCDYNVWWITKNDLKLQMTILIKHFTIEGLWSLMCL